MKFCEYKNKSWLFEHYIVKELSCKIIASLTKRKVTPLTIHKWLKRNGITPRKVGDHMRGERNHFLGKHLSTETKQKIALSNTGRNGTFESRRKQSLSVLGNKNHRFGKERGHGKGQWIATVEGQRIYLRSRWECMFADYLQSKGTPWSYEPVSFRLSNGSIYTPDFFSEGMFYEVKGYMSSEDKAKIELFRDEYYPILLEVIDGESLIRFGYNIKERGKIELQHLLIDQTPVIATCIHCNKSFVKKRASHRYCSLQCVGSILKNGGKTQLFCIICSKPFMVFPSATKYRTCCSPKCGRIAMWEKRHAAGRTRASNLQGAGTALKHQLRTERVYLTWNSEEGMLW